MNERIIYGICILIVIIGLIAFSFSDKAFQEKSVSETKEGETGLFFGKVDYVIKNSPNALFGFNDGNKILVFYQKEFFLEKNDFVLVYAKKQLYNGKEELYAYKVIKE